MVSNALSAQAVQHRKTNASFQPTQRKHSSGKAQTFNPSSVLQLQPLTLNLRIKQLEVYAFTKYSVNSVLSKDAAALQGAGCFAGGGGAAAVPAAGRRRESAGDPVHGNGSASN